MLSLALALLLSTTDAYFGFDIDLLAESLARLTTLRTQHGEQPGNAKFEEWLQEKGTTRAKYEKAYAAWWERFRADHTGQLEARFHRINSEYVQRLNFADAPDVRAETREGVTLDQYTRVNVAIMKKEGPLAAILKKNGVRDEAQWTRANNAWAAAMREDKSFTIIQQYGALFQKYMGADWANQQGAKTAAILAEGNARPAPPAEKPKPPQIDDIAARLEEKDRAQRWQAARQYALQCDLKAHPGYCDPATLRTKLLPVMLDALDHFDDATLSYATGLLDFFGELNLKTPEAKMTVQRALNRTEERLATLESSFKPIQDKAVPERIVLRTKVDEHTAAVREFRDALAKW